MPYIYEKKQTSDLFHDLKRMGRDNFTYEGAKALMEYFEELANDQGAPIEYDPIAYCCDYTEFENIAEFNKQYKRDYESVYQIDETYFIMVDKDSFIIQNF